MSSLLASPAWTLSVAATGGATTLWSNTGATQSFDYNDAGGSPAGCSDGADVDSAAGQMTIQPSVATNTPQGGCSTSNINLGSDTGFQEGSINSIVLASASSSAQSGCYWDFTNIGVNQTIPAEQESDTYTTNLTVTITAL